MVVREGKLRKPRKLTFISTSSGEHCCSSQQYCGLRSYRQCVDVTWGEQIRLFTEFERIGDYISDKRIYLLKSISSIIFDYRRILRVVVMVRGEKSENVR